MGYSTTASGDNSTAMGSKAHALGDHSFAINLSATQQTPGVPAHCFRIDGAATIGGNVAWTHGSDRRLKEDITPLSNELDKINSLTPVSFKWKEVNEGVIKTDNLGIIAQELKEIYPEVVKGVEDEEMLSVEYTGLIAPMIKAIQELSNKVDILSEENKELREIINGIK